MKITSAEVGFNPVIMTLTSQSEVDYLAALVGCSNPAVDEALGISPFDSQDIFEQLDSVSSPSRPRSAIKMTVREDC